MSEHDKLEKKTDEEPGSADVPVGIRRSTVWARAQLSLSHTSMGLRPKMPPYRSAIGFSHLWMLNHKATSYQTRRAPNADSHRLRRRWHKHAFGRKWYWSESETCRKTWRIRSLRKIRLGPVESKLMIEHRIVIENKFAFEPRRPVDHLWEPIFVIGPHAL